MQKEDILKTQELEKSEKIWDIKAKSFPRYKSQDKEVLENLDFFNNYCDIRGKNILDIGCGCGRYTLHLAKKANKVFANDLSSRMLEVLDMDAKTNNLTNITTFHMPLENLNNINKIENINQAKNLNQVENLGEIQNLKINNKENLATTLKSLDIHYAFASQTPALNSLSSLIEVSKITNALLYIGWANKRSSIFLEEIFALHKAKLLIPTGVDNIYKNAKSLGFKLGDISLYDITTTKMLDFNEAFESIKWHLQIHEITPNEELIKEYINKKLNKNKKICYTLEANLGRIFIDFKPQ